MRFSVLGLVSLSDDAQTVVLPPSKSTSLLAAMLLRPNQTVAVDYLTTVVWEDSPPPTARATLQTYILRLRRLFQTFGVAGGVIETVPGGYRFPATAATLDLVEFRELAGQAALAADPQLELGLLRRALALWQGQPLENIRSGPLQREVLPCLVEEWLDTAERRFELELDVGRHREVIAGLRAAVREHPGHERFWEQLIESLYRSGRQADALTEYGNVKRYLREELGIDPGPGLRRLELAILRAEELPRQASPVALSLSGGRPAQVAMGSEPVQWPGGPDLIGRTAEADVLRSWLEAHRGAALVVISGPPGIGKTALAVRVAHLVRPAFPAPGQLVRMTGPDGSARSASEIRAEITQGAASHVDIARSLTVFDDVVDVGPIPGLLRSGTVGAAIITSRFSLPGLADLPDLAGLTVRRKGMVVLHLGALDAADSVELLTQAIGERASVDRVVKERVAEMCGHVPAALIGAADRLSAGGPDSVIRWEATVASDPMNRLGSTSDRASSFFQRLGGYLSTLDEGLVEFFVAAASRPEPATGAIRTDLIPAVQVEMLMGAGLLEPAPAGGYRIPPMLRNFALTWAEQHGSTVDQGSLTNSIGDAQ